MDGGNIYIQAKSGENSISCFDNGSVRLYHDNGLKLETTSSGFNVTGTGVGNFKADDNEFLTAGTGDDLQIYHDGIGTYLDNNTGHIYIRNNVDDSDGGNIYIQALSGENSITCFDNGSVRLYYDNALKLETTSSGVDIPGTLTVGVLNFPDGDELTFGASNDFQIYHDGGTGTETNDTFLDNNTGDLWIRNNVDDVDGGNIYIQAKAGEYSIACYDDSSVRLYYDGLSKLETTSSGFNVAGTGVGNFKADDNEFLTAGTGDDFQIYHDGTDTFLDNDTG